MTDAQKQRNARKRAKSRAHKRGIAPHTRGVSLSTYIWDGWHDLCFAKQNGEIDFNCFDEPTVHAFWGYKTCVENLVQHHFRSIHSGWLVNSGHEISSHVRDYVEAHGESIRHHKALLKGTEGGCKIRWGWNAQTQRPFSLEVTNMGDTFIRTELVVRNEQTHEILGGKVWQGIGTIGIGVADVIAAAESFLDL